MKSGKSEAIECGFEIFYNINEEGETVPFFMEGIHLGSYDGGPRTNEEGQGGFLGTLIGIAVPVVAGLAMLFSAGVFTPKQNQGKPIQPLPTLEAPAPKKGGNPMEIGPVRKHVQGGNPFRENECIMQGLNRQAPSQNRNRAPNAQRL